MEKRGFYELTDKEIHEMSERMENAAADYAMEINSGGLSVTGSHNVYEATTKMLFSESSKAKKTVIDFQIQCMEDRF